MTYNISKTLKIEHFPQFMPKEITIFSSKVISSLVLLGILKKVEIWMVAFCACFKGKNLCMVQNHVDTLCCVQFQDLSSYNYQKQTVSWVGKSRKQTPNADNHLILWNLEIQIKHGDSILRMKYSLKVMIGRSYFGNT